MPKTSVHIKACNIAASEAHNMRTKTLGYVRSDLSRHNESHMYIDHPLAKERALIAKRVKAKTGRKLQKNAEPILECVVVIKDDTTMTQLMDFCERCRREFGVTPLQIHMHKDEGHSRSKDWKPNLHAHIVWSVYGEDGRNVRLQKDDCRRMQTLAAECLGMERGKASDRRHTDALAYKIEQEEQHLRQTIAKRESMSEEIRRVESMRAQSAKLNEHIKKQQGTLAFLKELQSLKGDYPSPPQEDASEDAWRNYYKSLQAPESSVVLSNIRIMRPTRESRYHIFGRIDDAEVESRELSPTEYRHINPLNKAPLATTLQMFIHKFSDLIRARALRLWTDAGDRYNAVLRDIEDKRRGVSR